MEIEAGGNLLDSFVDSYEEEANPNGYIMQTQFGEIIESLMNTYKEISKDSSLFRDLHIFYLEDKLVTVNERGEEISFEFINKLLKVNLSIDLGEGYPEYLNEITKLVIVIPAFDIKRVIVYDMPEDLQKTILYNFDELKKNFNHDFKIYFSEEETPVL